MKDYTEKKAPLWKYLLIMIIPLTVLLYRPMIPLMTLKFGQEVKLSTVPFDPRDFFRGDYVALSFAIEDIDLNTVSPSLRLKLDAKGRRYGDEIEVYVTLEPDESGVYNAVFVSDTPGADDIYVRGKIEGRANRINYGNNLSRFYVKENTGLELEEAARKGQVRAIAKVWKGFITLDKIEM